MGTLLSNTKLADKEYSYKLMSSVLLWTIVLTSSIEINVATAPTIVVSLALASSTTCVNLSKKALTNI